MSAVIQGQNAIDSSISPAFVSSNALHVAQYVWDSATLSWIKQAGGSSGPSADVNVLNFPATQAVVQSGNWEVGSKQYSKRYAVVDDITSYLGEAVAGAGEGSGAWRIAKIENTVGGGLKVTYADGNTNFDNIWSNRDLISYS